MGERTSYAPGTFSWVDLSTTDPESAKSFYDALFGWTHEDMPAGEGMTYTMFSRNGKQVGAVSQQQAAERDQGIPPHWNNYVTVEDIEASAAKASELGGRVMMEPFDVLDVGRMAVLADPTGAVFMLWEPKRHIGAGLVNEPGTLCWNELSTNDASKATGFYESLFGWSREEFDSGAYTVVRVGDKSNGGIRPQSEREQGIPPNWMPYFAVDSCDDGAAKASELGGNAVVPPMDVPVADNARIAVIADPQGAMFGLFSGPLDP